MATVHACPRCFQFSGSCCFVPLQTCFVDITHCVAFNHPSTISPFPSVFPERFYTRLIVCSSSVSIHTLIRWFSMSFPSFTTLSHILRLILSLISIRATSTIVYFQFATPVHQLKMRCSSRSYHRLLQSPVT